MSCAIFGCRRRDASRAERTDGVRGLILRLTLRLLGLLRRLALCLVGLLLIALWIIATGNERGRYCANRHDMFSEHHFRSCP